MRKTKNTQITAILLAWLIIMLPIVQAQATQGPSPDTSPPDITNVLLTHGPTTLVTWTTNEQADSAVAYGNTTELDKNITKSDLETAHSLTIDTTPGTIYYYRITSCDAVGNCKSTSLDNFIAGPFYITANIPRYVRTTFVDIPGNSRAGATVAVLVNNVETRKTVINNDKFLFKNIQLQKGINTVKLTAVRDTETAEATYQVDVDDQPPLMNITIPPVVLTPTTTAKINVAEPVSLSITAANQTTNQTIPAGETEITINLQEGENLVKFEARDNAGFISILEERVIYDKGPPQFIETNLNQISPSYEMRIRVRGKLSEKGSVTVFVNGRPKETEATNEHGEFSIPILLERAVNYTTSRTRTALDTGIGWKNKIKLEAVDIAGLKASTQEVEVEYQLCGAGTWVDVHLTNPMPDTLNPRLLIEGLQQVGIGFNYTYRGTKKAEINPRSVRARILQLAPEFQEDYDNGLITTSTPPIRAQRTRTPSGAGYIQINFNTIDDPWALEGETAPTNSTMYDKEEKISRHREGDCLAVGLGCMKLFLELEIPVTETIKTTAYDPNIRQTVETEKPETKTQRTCVNIEVAIDKRIPPKYIPKGFLKDLSDFLTKVIEGIDAILKPIQTVGEYLFYTCIAGTVLALVPIFLEKYNCEWTKFATVATGKGNFDPKIAEINACNEQYPDDEEHRQARSNCNSCATAKNNRRDYDYTYRQICDRVMCPAAPSLQYYLRTKGKQTMTQLPAVTDAVMKKYPNAYTDTQEKLYTGSDCAAWVKEKQVKDDPKIAPRMVFSTTEIQGIYTNWLKHQSDTTETKGSCEALHPATPECCGYEYMIEWSSACGVSHFGNFLDTFDEIKQSTCLSAQKLGKNEIQGKDGSVSCNNLVNAITGFCDSGGGAPPDPIRVTAIESTKAEQMGLQQFAETRDLYIVVQQKAGAILGQKLVGMSEGYDIGLAVLVKKLEWDRTADKKGLQGARTATLTDKVEIVYLTGYADFQSTYFSDDAMNGYFQTGNPPAGFGERLCTAAGKTSCPDIGENGKTIYGTVADSIGTPEKEYIIKPNDGLVNSVRCLCFPTTIAYLQMWRNIMAAVRNCANTILLTGDGSSGVCQAAISQYACDLIYEALACFTQQFSSGTTRGTRQFPDIIGALTSTGTELATSVQGRYGQTGMYNAVFVERKLVHAVCMWAFTGTWNFDVATMFDQSVAAVPKDSYALLTPCNRRFISFNPATQPGGLATWLYHFGVGFAAGADADLELRLRCSGGYKCSEADGFVNKKCDCDTPREMVIVPDKFPTRVSNGDIVNEELFYTLQGAPGEAQIRYDTAVLVYKWKDGATQREGKAECTIGQTGGTASVPAFCSFDLFTQSFRCKFGEASSGIRFTDVKSNYPHKTTKGDLFALDEDLTITLSIQQDYPGGVANNKHLEVTVMDPAGEIIKTNSGGNLILLTTNGDYSKTIGTKESTFPVQIEKEKWFKTTEGKKYAVKQWTSKIPNLFQPNDMIEDTALYSETGAILEERRQFVVELVRKPDKVEYNIYRATVSTRTDPQKGFVDKDPTPLCTGTVTGNRISCTGQTLVFRGTVSITLTEKRPTLGETLQAHIDYSPLKVNVCGGDVKDRQVQPFKIKFVSYDSNQYGEPTEQISADTLTGAETIKETTFNVICATAEELAPIEEKKPETAPRPAPGECTVPADCTTKYGPAAPGWAYICSTGGLCQSTQAVQTCEQRNGACLTLQQCQQLGERAGQRLNCPQDKICCEPMEQAVPRAEFLLLEETDLDPAKIGQTYSNKIVIFGGQIPMTCTAQGLPSGLSIKAEPIVNEWYCIITGTPTGASGTYPVSVTVKDNAQKTISKAYQLPVMLSQSAAPQFDKHGNIELSADKKRLTVEFYWKADKPFTQVTISATSVDPRVKLPVGLYVENRPRQSVTLQNVASGTQKLLFIAKDGAQFDEGTQLTYLVNFATQTGIQKLENLQITIPTPATATAPGTQCKAQNGFCLTQQDCELLGQQPGLRIDCETGKICCMPS